MLIHKINNKINFRGWYFQMKTCVSKNKRHHNFDFFKFTQNTLLYVENSMLND